MFFEHRAFWLPKDVGRTEEFQDAWCVDEERGLAAIADGVSSSLFSASWAKILTKAVVDDPPYVDDPPSLPDWFQEHRDAWIEPIDENGLAWHQKPKFKLGAHTTLLWVEMYVADEKKTGVRDASEIYGYAVGDSCLFHVREDKVIRSFPLTDSQSFLNDPHVIGSIDKQQDHLLQFETWESYCQPGDLLVLCTDAIAAWAVARMENGTPPKWRSYWNRDPDEWRREILDLRERQEMRADDATLLLLRIVDPKAKPSSAAGDSDSADVEQSKDVGAEDHV
ncbi:MAG: protein phosphatase 2C domain-containing protein [Pirellulaceae bacterium]